MILQLMYYVVSTVFSLFPRVPSNVLVVVVAHAELKNNEYLDGFGTLFESKYKLLVLLSSKLWFG